MVPYQARRIIGNWREGFALDIHTVSSLPIGYNEYGHMQFDTTRSLIGELLYKLKTKRDTSVVDEIADTASAFLGRWNQPIDIIVPVPPSNQRSVQPVSLIADALSTRLGKPVADCVAKTREARQLKNVFDLDERLRLLDGLYTVAAGAVEGRRVLLFDDLYRSGATMNAISEVLQQRGRAADVVALAITRTRSFR